MNQQGWPMTIRRLFRPKVDQDRRVSRTRRSENRKSRIESLEQRRLLAVDFVSASVVDGEPFFSARADQALIPSAGTLNESPQQVTLRFTPGTEIDPASLGGISIVRSGGPSDDFGASGSLPDVTVTPGVLVVDDLPARNQVIIRFKETLPDDTYRFTISSDIDQGTGEITGLRTTDGQAFRGGGSFSFDVRVSVGPQVVAVVPQPITRAADNLLAPLTQSRDVIEVWFDAAESLDVVSAETVASYKLIEVDNATGEDVAASVRHPLRVNYNPTTNHAVLTFAPGELLDARLYRLEIGGAGILANPTNIPLVGDAGSSYDTAFSAGLIDEAGVTISASIDAESSVEMPGTLPDLLYPGQPGTIDEPGHRDIPIDFSNHGLEELAFAPANHEIHTIPFNFKTHYGNDAEGNPLSNLITAEQKLRVREVFDLFSRFAGARFVETIDEGITIALGDTRVISDNSPVNSLEGLWRGSVVNGVPSTDALAIVNSNQDWGQSEYGGTFFRASMRQIGKVLGMWHSYDVPSVLGESVSGEAVFPTDYDLIHLQQLFPPSGTDIDLYSFSLEQAGTLSAETFADRLSNGASTLDSVLSVFSESYGTNTRASGVSTTVSGVSTSIDGLQATVSGVATTVTGVGARVTGLEATVAGSTAIVNGAKTTALGSSEEVTGVAARVLGHEATVQAVASSAVGTRASITAVAAEVTQAVTGSTTVFLDSVAGISTGQEVLQQTGVPLGTTVEAIDTLAKSVVLSNSVTVNKESFLGFDLALSSGAQASRFLLSNAAAASIGAPVNAVESDGYTEQFTNTPEGVPADTTVADVDITSGMVAFSQAINVLNGSVLGFGSTTAQIALEDAAAIPVGSRLGIATGDYATDIERPQVIAVNRDSGVVTLTKPHVVAAGEQIAFDFNPEDYGELAAPFTGTKFFLSGLSQDIEVGLLVSSPQGIEAGTTIEAINYDTGVVTFSDAVTLSIASTVGFGFSGTSVKVDDATAITTGAFVEGMGVPEGTQVQSVDAITGELLLSTSVVVPDGLMLGFSLPGSGAVTSSRLVVKQGDPSLAVGAPVSNESGADLGVTITSVNGRVITLSGAVNILEGQVFGFGSRGRTIYVSDPSGVQVGTQMTANTGVGANTIVTAVDYTSGRIMLSQDVTLLHDASVQFGFTGFTVEVSDATAITVGAPIAATVGVDEGTFVTNIEGNSLTLSKRVAVHDGSDLLVGSVGKTFVVGDSIGIVAGVLVAGTGIPDGTRVVSVDNITETITLDTSATLSAGAVLGFGTNVGTVTLNTTAYDGQLAGASVTLNGVPVSQTVTSIAGDTVTLSGALDVAHDDVLGFGFTGPISTKQIVLDSTAGLTVGSELAGSGGATVTGIDVTSKFVTLSDAQSVSATDAMQFGFHGTELILTGPDVPNVAVGAPLTGAGLSGNIFVTAIDAGTGAATVSEPITVAHGALLDVGFAGQTLRVNNITGINLNVPISGVPGIRPGTLVNAIDPVTRELSLSQPVQAAAGGTVSFGFSGTTVGVASTNGIAVGAPVSGLPGVNNGSVTVAGIGVGTVTLSTNVTTPHDLPLQFGFSAANVVTVDDVTDLEIGDAVTAPGIPANTTITNVDAATNQLTLTNPVTITANAKLGFGTATRKLIARNDNSFGKDSFLEIELDAGNYFVAVTSVGNTHFEPAVEQSGAGGRSQGEYDLSLKFRPQVDPTDTLIDGSGTALDGDRDGDAGGVFNFWFRTASETNTIYVDKLAFVAEATTTSASETADVPIGDVTGISPGLEVVASGVPAGTTVKSIFGTTLTLSNNVGVAAGQTFRFANPGTGTLADPYRTISDAIAEAEGDATKAIVRVVGNTGAELSDLTIAGTTRSLRPNALESDIDPHHYYVGLDESGNALSDGNSLRVPAGVTLMVDAGTVLRMRQANIEVGSSSELDSRSEASLQILGVPNHTVRITSAVQGAFNGEDVSGPAPEGGDWGGIVMRADSDWQPSGILAHDTLRPFLNTLNNAVIEYAGGEVEVDSEVQEFSAIELEGARPSLAFNQILRSASNAISATPNSFLEAGGRAGPQLSGNTLLMNSTNGLFIKIRSEFGVPLDTLDVAARFTSTQITYVLQENFILSGGQGSYFKDSAGEIRARASGRLAIDPGVVVKLQNARIELERGAAELIAEGHPTQRVTFTNLGDNRFGAGGTFNTNGNLPDGYGPGRWGGIVLNAGSQASIDNAFISGGGGEVPIEGRLDLFNVIEVHQGDLRLVNSRIQNNADGVGLTDRSARGPNDAATIFVRGAQPIIAGNDFRDNAGATISINANSMSDRFLPDVGRQTGLINRLEAYDDNFGPLIRDNQISYATTEPIIVGYDEPLLSAGAHLPTDGSVQQIDWKGQQVDVLTDSWVIRASTGNTGPIDFVTGWTADDLGGGFYEVDAPGASVSDVVAWATENSTVAYAEPNFLLQNQRVASDPRFNELWGLNNTGQNGGLDDADIDAPEAWDITTGSDEVVIAVIDTGVDYNHEDLAANIWTNPGEIAGDGIDNDGNGFVDDVRGWDFANDDNDPMDTDGHGTHVAGTIGAAANNGIGIVGVSWNVKIIPIKFLDPFGTTTAAIRSVTYVTTLREQGVNVIASNNSWGGGGYSQALFDAIEGGGEAGVLFVAAAGNDSNNNDQNPAYPASYDSDAILSVAATDRNNGLAGFSNYGATTVDIGAPGVAILSTTPGNSYASFQGTSMASPHAAGVAALLAAANPEASMAEIRQAIISGAVPIPSLTNNVSSGALLNAPGALASLQSGGVSRIAGVVVRGEEITVDSVWDDTDIVHVLRDEIIVNNLHTATSLKLLSDSDASLVVKLAGDDAGFTASGELLDIDDRVGGTVQVIGQPSFPVIITSLYDDSVGASLDAYGFPITDTNVDGTGSEAAAGDWRGLQFLGLSNDRNVDAVLEAEGGFSQHDANMEIGAAEFLGTLAPNFSIDENTWESAQEKSGDNNRRLGFDVSGTISFNNTADVDVYSFDGYAGSEVWIDIDQTTSALDTMVEILDAGGRVLARSANSQGDTGSVIGETITAAAGGSAIVAGEEAQAVATAAAVGHLGAEIVGIEALALGAVAEVEGVTAIIEGVEQEALGAVADAQKVASLVTAASNDKTVPIETDLFAGKFAGQPVFVNNKNTGVIVQSIAGTQVNVSEDLNVAADDVISFGLGGTPINTTSVGVNEVSLATVGGSIFIDGTPQTGVTVASVDKANNVVNLAFGAAAGNKFVTVQNGTDIGFGFTTASQISTTRIVVADTTEIANGVPVNGVATVLPGTEVSAVQTFTGTVGTVRFNQAITLSVGDTLGFGFNGSSVVIDTSAFDGLISAGADVIRNGNPTGLTVTSVVADTVNFSGSTDAFADGDVIGIGLNAPGQGIVTYDRLLIDRPDVATVGGTVFVNGVAQPSAIATVDIAGAAVELTAPVAVTGGDDLGLGFVGGISVDTSRITVADTTGIATGVLVSSGQPGVPAGTRVLNVNTLSGVAGTVDFDSELTLTSGSNLGFGFNGSIVEIDTNDLDGAILANASVLRNGELTSLTIASIAGGIVTFNGPTDIFADSDFIGVGLDAAGQPPVSYDRVYFDDDAASPFAQVDDFGTGNIAGGTVVADINSDGLITLSQNAALNSSEVIQFTHFWPGTEVSARRIVADDVAGVLPGVLVNEVNTLPIDTGVPTGTRVASVNPTTKVLNFTDSVSLSDAVQYGFGFSGAQIVFEDVTGLNDGETVMGKGVPAGTTIAGGGVDVPTRTVTFTQAVDVEDGATLTFTEQQFSLLPSATAPDAISILPGSISGVIFDGDTAIQTFQGNRDGSLEFSIIGNPPSRVLSGTIDYTTGLISLTFDTPPRNPATLSVDYGFSTLSLETIGFEPVTGVFGAYPLAKDAWRGDDFYTTNPRDAGARLTLPGTEGTKQKYFIRVRSQPEAGADRLEYEANLTQTSPLAEGLTSGNYNLSVRLRQRDEAPGSTVRFADIRFPLTGIDVVGLPNNSPLVGTAAEHPDDNNDTFANAQALGNLLTSDRNTISVAGEIADAGDIDWYTFTLSYEDIQTLFGHNDGEKTWATVLDLDYADGFRGDLSLSLFDEDGRLIYVGRDSNIADDQPGPGQEGGDIDDLSRGSVGKRDPFIGPAHLPAGSPSYAVVGSSGGAGVTVNTYDAPIGRTEYTFFYDAYSVPDAFKVEGGNTVFVDTGSISGSDTITFWKPEGIRELTVTVTGPEGTIWDYELAPSNDGVTGPRTYYVAVSSNAQIPSVLDQTFVAGAVNSDVRLEPVTSIQRIVEDHIGTSGYRTYSDQPGSTVPQQQIDANAIFANPFDDIALSANVRPFTLSDVVLYVSTQGSITAVNPFTGNSLRTLGSYGGGSIGDIDMRTDGSLYQYFGASGDTANNGLLREISWVDGSIQSEVGDGIADDPDSATDATRVWKITGDSVDALAIRRVGSNGSVPHYGTSNSNSGVWYSIRDGGQSVLYWARPDGDAATVDNQPNGRRGIIAGAGIRGVTTGLQFQHDRFSTLFGVSGRRAPDNGPIERTGQFYSVNTGSGAATLLADFSNVVDPNTGQTIGELGGFEGLANAPENLESGRYSGLFFAITGNGSLVVIDPDAPNGPALVENVFDTNGDGVADSFMSRSTVGSTGLAFSPLDINLWHPVGDNGISDTGRGVTDVPDRSRYPASTQILRGQTSFYFGISDTTTPQFGVEGTAFSWQGDLVRGAQSDLIGNNYNLPGGAQGSLISSPLSLDGYQSADRPTLYFNYWLETEGHQADAGFRTMRDSARVFASRDGGVTWELLATNNSDRSANEEFAFQSELPPVASVSSGISDTGYWYREDFGFISNPDDPLAVFVPTQRVQELFDASDWRQARIDLSEFAGESNVQLRFDFSTAGEMVANDDSTIIPSAVRSVTADTTSTPFVEVDSINGVDIGMVANLAGQQFVDDAIPSLSSTVVSVDPLTNTIEFNTAVTVATGSNLEFFKANQLKNQAEGLAGDIGIGDESSGGETRFTNNDFEGFYIDDIIIGFAERGEIVANAPANQTGFTEIGTPIDAEYPAQSLTGKYQLEIRRGTEYGVEPYQTTTSIVPREANGALAITSQFDTNDRFVEANSTSSHRLARTDLTTLDGLTLAPEGNGIVTVAGGAATLGAAAFGTTSHSVLKWNLDLQGTDHAFLDFDNQSETNQFRGKSFVALPAVFSTADRLPAGNGVALSRDGGTNWERVAVFTGGGFQRVNLIPDLSNPLTADTVIGFFHTGSNPGVDGIVLQNLIVTTAPTVETIGSIGDSNNRAELEQGQFIIQSNLISHAAEHGVRIDATRDTATDPFGNYVGVTLEPELGATRNLPVHNNAGLVPGAVVSNNVITGPGVTGIVFSGTTSSDEHPQSVIPFGRIVNNTIYGGEGSAAIGINVNQNAGPTILNNVFAELSTGIVVDASSQYDVSGNQRTVIGTSAFHAVGVEVRGADQNLGLTLDKSPFVNAPAGNFYPTVGTGIVDSALSSLQDRTEYRVVTESIGMPESPIVSPIRDVYGQLRVDDPNQANAPGLGGTVFQDRGAVERVDQSRPYGRIIMPLDQGVSPTDTDGSLDSVVIEGADALGIRTIAIKLHDIGVGIDKSTVSSDAFVVTRDGVRLLDTIDYRWVYNENNDQVIFQAISVFPLGEYTIEVLSEAADSEAGITGKVTDRANNPLRSNATGERTTFFIALADVPGAVSGLIATPGNQSASLGWQAPLGSIAKPVIDYTVQWLEAPSTGTPDWDTASEEVVSTRSFNLPSVGHPIPLSNNTEYLFRVAARNAIGLGGFTQITQPIVPRAQAAAPTIFAGIAGYDSFLNQSLISLDWTDVALGDLGGNTLIDYQIEYRQVGQSDWHLEDDGISTASEATITGSANDGGLVPGQNYEFRVAAVTMVAESGEEVVGTFSAPYVIMAEGLPGAPTILSSTPNSDGSLHVTWQAPDFDGGSVITDYEIWYSVDNPSNGSVNWTLYPDSLSASPYADISSSTAGPGNSLWLQVRAVNSHGAGTPSATSSRLVLPHNPTGTITVDELLASHNRIDLEWYYEASATEAEVTGFRLERRENETSGWSAWSQVIGSTNSPYVDTGVVNGIIYQYRITATNVFGNGALSLTDSVTPRTSSTEPGKPAGTIGDRQVTLVWSAPADDGGTPITDYVIEMTETDPDGLGSVVWQAYEDGVRSTTAATVTGLENGTQYWFRVTGKTAVLGNPSDHSDGYVPLARATAPQSIEAARAEGVSGAVDLTWLEPTDRGGSEITGYFIQYSRDSGASWATADGSVVTAAIAGETARLTGLTNGLGYSFRIAAITGAGTGIFSTRSNLVIPVGLAPAPTISSAVPQADRITIFLSDPDGGYGATVVDYEVEWKAGSSAEQKSFTGGNTWFTATGLDPATQYEFRVRVKLATGIYGEWSHEEDDLWFTATTD